MELFFFWEFCHNEDSNPTFESFFVSVNSNFSHFEVKYVRTIYFKKSEKIHRCSVTQI